MAAAKKGTSGDFYTLKSLLCWNQTSGGGEILQRHPEDLAMISPVCSVRNESGWRCLCKYHSFIHPASGWIEWFNVQVVTLGTTTHSRSWEKAYEAMDEWRKEYLVTA